MSNSNDAISTPISLNPYGSLIETSKNNPAQIQACYQAHRITRNTQQKGRFLSPDFEGVSVDPILLRLDDPSIEPGFVDTRNSMVFIARPPQKVQALIQECQKKLKEVIPNLWIVPKAALHITALEIAHSRTADEIAALVPQIRAAAQPMVNHALTHRTRLIQPLLCFDASAIAISFLPENDSYTYHHLRRDLFDQARGSGVEMHSRYAAPSAHLTVGRFIRAKDLCTSGTLDPEKTRGLVARIEWLNAWLEREFWPAEDGAIRDGGEWAVGEEMGLEWRVGALWYGSGGETLMMGEGF
ncbi:RNA ligase/cyclic nucleotide phosphodiesterase [Mycena rosella]|uniref:RNA ligase/cyclic nucleotide phosphodiesterase n=1 Tax=Mycena rosella TaxID=1033263 RepID=A0AAD7D893_MYCRO|nr:RNA ligase/cyclic nucleotide phosphodiesterase [Mycena rosella]